MPPVVIGVSSSVDIALGNLRNCPIKNLSVKLQLIFAIWGKKRIIFAKNEQKNFAVRKKRREK